MTIPTQKEWVEGCLAYYKENDYQPGNPEDGEWHECHYPVPKSLGGTETVLLLKEHHAVQGVLQSEEFQHPCVWTWEAKFLSGEFLSLCKKWEGRKTHIGWERMSPHKRAERAEMLRRQAQGAGELSWARSSLEERERRRQRLSLAISNSRRAETQEQKRQRAVKKGKPIEITTPSGEVLLFPLVKDAAQKLGLSENDLAATARGVQKTTRGHRARYL